MWGLGETCGGLQMASFIETMALPLNIQMAINLGGEWGCDTVRELPPSFDQMDRMNSGRMVRESRDQRKGQGRDDPTKTVGAHAGWIFGGVPSERHQTVGPPGAGRDPHGHHKQRWTQAVYENEWSAITPSRDESRRPGGSDRTGIEDV